MQKLPIGIQKFKKLRENNFLYIDKTEHIHQLTNSGGGYYFLSRPRRFGKSLLVSTIEELFRGQSKLFKGLWIENHWNWKKKHPIIDLHFNKASYKVAGLESFIVTELRRIAETYGFTLKETSYPSQLEDLIVKLSNKYGPVVLLVDEYDKPIIDYLEDASQAMANREILKNLYSVLKPLDEHLRFVLVTGVSKFSRVSIFSELNNLTDLTFHPRYMNLLGYTQLEIEKYFADRIEYWATKFGRKEVLLNKIKEWYNGYSWDGKHYVYNPFSVLSFFDRGRFENFWFETGTPTFLVKLLNREHYYNLENIETGPLISSSFELDRIDPNVLLFQTGYITVKHIDEDQIYTLSYPNKEVKDSLLQYLLAEYTFEYPTSLAVKAKRMRSALERDDLESFVVGINALFSSIPSQIFIANKEAYYHSIVYLVLSLMGAYIKAEVSQAKGRPDIIVYTAKSIYIMEFKMDKNAEQALQQIKQQGYLLPFKDSNKTIRAVGLNFKSEIKGIDSWVEEVQNTITQN